MINYEITQAEENTSQILLYNIKRLVQYNKTYLKSNFYNI